MGYTHQMVVDDVCEVVGRISVGFDQNQVFQLLVVYGDVSVDLIVEGCGSFGRHIETDDVRFAGCQIGLYFLFGKTKAVFVVDRDFFSAYVTLALAQALCVTEAVISVTLLYQLFCIFQVQTCCITLALYVRAAAAVFVRSLVVYQAGLF